MYIRQPPFLHPAPNPKSDSAEREGFEPPEPCSSTVFKTAAIDHSAIFPSAKITSFFHSTKLLLTGTERKGIRE